MTELSTLEGARVLYIQRQANAPATVVVDHVISADSSSALEEGDFATFSWKSAQLFEGRVKTVRRNTNEDEGVIYICADEYTWLMKTTATQDKGTADDQGNTSRVKYKAGTLLQDVIDDILRDCPIPVSVSLPDATHRIQGIDRESVSIHDLLTDLLEAETEDCIAYVDSWTSSPELIVKSRSDEPPLTVARGSAIPATPSPDEFYFADGTLEKSCGAGFKKLIIEGAGKFKRKIGYHPQWIKHYPLDDDTDKVVVEFGTEYDEVTDRILAPVDISSMTEEEINSIPYEAAGNRYRPENHILVTVSGTAVNGIGWKDGNILAIMDESSAPEETDEEDQDVEMNFTAWLGPFTTESESSSSAMQGERQELHDRWLFYDGSENDPSFTVDQTSQMQAFTESRHKRLINDPDMNSEFIVLATTSISDARIGAKIPSLEDRWIRQVRFSPDSHELRIWTGNAVFDDEFQARRSSLRSHTKGTAASTPWDDLRKSYSDVHGFGRVLFERRPEEVGGEGGLVLRWLRVDGGHELNASPKIDGITARNNSSHPLDSTLTLPPGLSPGSVNGAGTETTPGSGPFPDGFGYAGLWENGSWRRVIATVRRGAVLSGWRYMGASSLSVPASDESETYRVWILENA